MFFQRIIDQERNPAFTGVSIVTTIFVSLALIIINTHHYREWGGIARFPFTVFSLACGLLINFVCGIMAFERNEYWGGRIALIGAALWFVVLFALGVI
jgi:hypothetical protein